MNENESIVAGYFLGKKLDALHVAAVMANIEAESGFDPGGVEAGNGIGTDCANGRLAVGRNFNPTLHR